MTTFDNHNILETIRVRWRTLVLISAISACVAALYLVLVTPVYRATIDFIPPTARDINGLTLLEVGVNNYNESDVFQFFKTQLAFTHIQTDFLKKKLNAIINESSKIEYIKTSGEGKNRKTGDWSMKKTIHWFIDPDSNKRTIYKYNYNNLRISTIKDPENYDVLQLQVDWRNPVEASEIANRYAEFVNDELSTSLIENITIDLENSIENISSNIAFKRQVAQMVRDNQILILQEAAQVAESLGYYDPVTHTANNTLIQITPPEEFYLNSGTLGQDPAKLLQTRHYLPMYQTGSITRSGGISTQGSTSPLYFRGAKALNAEIIVLNNRSSDDPYIPELMTLVKQKEWLTSLLVKDKKARVIGDYEPSYPNTKQVYPKPLLVLIIATLIGIILGMITILAMQVISEKAQLLPRSFSRFT